MCSSKDYLGPELIMRLHPSYPYTQTPIIIPAERKIGADKCSNARVNPTTMDKPTPTWIKPNADLMAFLNYPPRHPNYPYAIPDEHKIDADKPSSESRFNLTHGFMWGKRW